MESSQQQGKKTSHIVSVGVVVGVSVGGGVGGIDVGGVDGAFDLFCHVLVFFNVSKVLLLGSEVEIGKLLARKGFEVFDYRDII